MPEATATESEEARDTVAGADITTRDSIEEKATRGLHVELVVEEETL